MIKLVFEGIIPSKKNSKNLFRNSRTGKMFITSSDKYKAWNQAERRKLKSQLNQLRIKRITCPVYIVYEFYIKDKRKFDLSNKVESINDLLVDVGLLKDDNWGCISGENILLMGLDKENPRCVVTIF